MRYIDLIVIKQTSNRIYIDWKATGDRIYHQYRRDYPEDGIAVSSLNSSETLRETKKWARKAGLPAILAVLRDEGKL